MAVGGRNITSMTENSSFGELVPVRDGSDPSDMSRLAEELVASAAHRGVQLTGEGGLLTALTRQVLQAALEVEMAQHLGYEKRDPVGRSLVGGANLRNGTSPKTVRTEVGEVTIDVPRDRMGTFEPQIVAKHQRRLAGFDEAVISLYAKGMTTGDIAAHLEEVYDTEISRDLVSKVTDQVLWGVTLLVDSRYQEGTTGNHVYESQDVHAGVQSRRGPVGGAGAPADRAGRA